MGERSGNPDSLEFLHTDTAGVVKFV